MFGVGIHDVNCDRRLVLDATNPIYIGTRKKVEVVLLPSASIYLEDEDEGYERYEGGDVRRRCIKHEPETDNNYLLQWK